MTSQPDWTSAQLLARYRAGEAAAADEIFQRYLERLTRLARARLSRRLASRTDADDVVQSAWRSFFIGVREDRFALQRSGDLWRLMVSIMMHKLYRQVRHHQTESRSVNREQVLNAGNDREFLIADRQPHPEEAVALAELVEACLTEFDAMERQIFERRLQGETIEEIARELKCSERTIRRRLGEVQAVVARQLEQSDVPQSH